MALIGHWKFDGNTNDSSASPASMWNSGSIGSGYGVYDTALIFGSQYTRTSANVPSIPKLELRHDLTISFWIYVYNYPASRMGICQTYYGGEIALNIGSNGRLEWYYGTSGAQAHPYTNHNSPAGTVEEGKWVHITLVRDLTENKTKYYKNGEMISDRSITYQCVAANTKFWLGRSYTGYCDAKLDDFRIYDEVLSDTQIKELSKGLIGHWKLDGTAKDWSSNEYTSTLVHNQGISQWSGDTPKYSLSYDKTAFNQNITTNANRLGYVRNLTVSVWFKFDGTNSSAVCGCRNSSNNWMIYRNSQNSTGQIHILRYYTNTSSGVSSSLRSAYISETDWNHIIAQWDDNGRMRYWLNGEIKHDYTPSNFLDWKGNVTNFQIGRGGTGHSGFIGNISDVKIYGSWLDDEECMELWRSNMKLTNDKHARMSNVVDTKYPNLITDYNTWTIGNGSVGSFIANGSASENVRYLSTTGGPYGYGGIYWRADPDSSNDADGGWNHTYSLTEDMRDKYGVRHSVWIYRSGNTNGTTYIGCRRNDGVAFLTGGTASNPYFWHGNPPTMGAWYLYVGHIRPSNFSGTDTHWDSGIYNTSGTKVANINRDFKFLTTATVGDHRTYLYYCTNTSNRQYWMFPRVDICDGTEPSIQDLIHGKIDQLGSTQETLGKKEVVWYKFNETSGSTATDSSDNGWNATLHNGVSFVPGKINNCVEFDGSNLNEYVSMSNRLIPPGHSEYTACAWVKWDGGGGGSDGRRFICETHGSGSPWAISMAVNSGANPVFIGYCREGSNTRQVTGTTNVVIGQWYHVCVTYKKDGLKGFRLYVNGVEEDASATSGSLIDSSGINIGTHRDANNRWFDGSIDDFRVYSRVLNSAELKKIINDGDGSEESISGNRANPMKLGTNCTRVNKVNITGKENPGLVGWWKMNGSGVDEVLEGDTNIMSFSADPTPVPANKDLCIPFTAGDNATITMNDRLNITKGNFTVAFWFKFDASTDTTTVNLFDTDFNNGGLTVEKTNFVDNNYVAIKTTAGTYIFTTYELFSDTWYHVCISCDNGSTSVYINGLLDWTPSISFSETTASNITLGGSGFSNNFVGNIRDLRIYNMPLSAKQAALLYKTSGGDNNVIMSQSDEGVNTQKELLEF